jgi:hypothetical protein
LQIFNLIVSFHQGFLKVHVNVTLSERFYATEGSRRFAMLSMT